MLPSPAGFDAVIFDLDGTLANSGADIADALRAAFAHLGVEPAHDVMHLVDGSPLEEIFAAMVPGGTEHDLVRFVDAYRKHYHEHLTRQTTLYPGVADTLEAIHLVRPRPRLAVASSKRAATAQALVDALGIGDYFDVVTGSGASRIPPKPAPDLLLHAAQELGVAASRTLVVGDTARDVVAGQRAGMRTAAVMYGLGRADQLEKARPDYLFEEIDEILLVLGLRE